MNTIQNYDLYSDIDVAHPGKEPLDMFANYADEFLKQIEETKVIYSASEVDKLRKFEHEPVGIVEFVTSDKYLNLERSIFPAALWILKMFYNTQECYEDVLITSSMYGKYRFPGFATAGYTKEQFERLTFNELALLIGQRSLKSVVSAIIADYEAYKLLCTPNVWERYGVIPGGELIFSIGATSLEQACQTVYAYVTGFRDGSPWFRNFIECASTIKVDGKPIYADRVGEFEFKHRAILINAVHARSGSLRGATRKGFVIDEIAHFDLGAAQKSAESVHTALSNSTETFKDSAVRVVISSPLYPLDMMCQLFAKSGTKFSSPFYADKYKPLAEIEGRAIMTNPKSLAFHYPTWDLNPNFPFDYWVPKINSNPDITLRDFGALPSMAKHPFISDLQAIDLVFKNSDIPVPINSDNQLREDWFVNLSEACTPIFVHLDAGAGKPSNFGIAAGYGVTKLDSYTKKPLLRVKIIAAHSILPDPKFGEVDFEQAHELVEALIRRLFRPRYSSDGWEDFEFRQHLVREQLVSKAENLKVTDAVYDNLKQLILSRRIDSHYSSLGCEEIKRLELANGTRVCKGLAFTKDQSDCIAAVAWRVVSSDARGTSADGRAIMGAY